MNQAIEIPAEPIIVERKHEVINASLKRATSGALAVNHFIEVFTSLNIGTLSLDDLATIQHQGLEKFIRNRVAESVPMPQVGGLTINREKFLAMLDIPDLTELRLAFNQADTFIPLPIHGLTLRDGVAEVDQQWSNQMIDSNTHYLKTDAEKEGWLITQDIIQKMDYLYNRFGIQLASGAISNLHQSAGLMERRSDKVTELRYPGQYFDQLQKGAARLQGVNAKVQP